MLILFDHTAPAPLRYALKGHVVTEAVERGWDRLVNGALLDVAEVAASRTQPAMIFHEKVRCGGSPSQFDQLDPITGSLQMRIALLCLIFVLLPVRDGLAQSLDLQNAPVSVCDLIGNGRAYNGLRIAVHGTLVRGVLQPHGCYAEIITNGHLWPTCITLQQFGAVEGRTVKRLLPFSDDDPGAGFSVVLVGRFQMGTVDVQQQTTGRPPGLQTPARCPATLVYERVVSVQPVVVPAISVCDLVASPLRYNNAVVTVRGRFVVENGLDVLRGNNCTDTHTRQPGSISLGIPFTHRGYISPTSRENIDGGESAIVMTVTGRFVAAKAGSAIEKPLADEESQLAYPGELIFCRTRQVKIEIRDKRQ